MPTTNEYAQLSNRVYTRTDENRAPVPAGWAELEHFGDDLTGFSAGVYQNGTDIVIAYTGTNESQVRDFALANIPAALSLPSSQVTEAMELYLNDQRGGGADNEERSVYLSPGWRGKCAIGL